MPKGHHLSAELKEQIYNQYVLLHRTPEEIWETMFPRDDGQGGDSLKFSLRRIQEICGELTGVEPGNVTDKLIATRDPLSRGGRKRGFAEALEYMWEIQHEKKRTRLTTLRRDLVAEFYVDPVDAPSYDTVRLAVRTAGLS